MTQQTHTKGMMAVTNRFNIKIGGLGLLILGLWLTPALAQLSAEELRREQIETIEALKHTEDISGGSSRLFGSLGRRTGWGFNYGAAYSTTYTGGDNRSDLNSSTADANDHSYDYEIKPFVNITTQDKKTKFYLRLTSKYTEAKKNSASTLGNNFIQPTVDMMYWEKTFEGKGKEAGVKRKFVVGRQFVQVGRGIAFALAADGIFYEATGLASRKFEYKCFVLKQNPSDDNIDASSSGSGRTKRLFYGIRGKYQLPARFAGLAESKVSLYTVHSKDQNQENSPTVALQKHKFEPQYYGLVSEGRIFPSLHYWGEYIIERGKTFDSSTAVASKEVGINASALVAGLRYYFDAGGDRKPTVYGEFITATGDPEATTSNSTLGGSAAGTHDSRFIPFGGISLGYTIPSTMTNMKVYKVGGSIKPMAYSRSRMLQDITLQPEYYVFRRRTGNTGAGGNDSLISYSSTNRIGDKFDFSVSWRLMSDVVYQLKYGHFSPGSAYTAPANAAETYWRFKVSIEM